MTILDLSLTIMDFRGEEGQQEAYYSVVYDTTQLFWHQLQIFEMRTYPLYLLMAQESWHWQSVRGFQILNWYIR